MTAATVVLALFFFPLGLATGLVWALIDHRYHCPDGDLYKWRKGR
jgi:hypothetical protein